MYTQHPFVQLVVRARHQLYPKASSQAGLKRPAAACSLLCIQHITVLIHWHHTFVQAIDVSVCKYHACRVVAGPGSGKTRVLMSRVAHLLTVGAVQPQQVMTITFSNRAAQELKDRLKDQVGHVAAGHVTTGGLPCTWAARALLQYALLVERHTAHLFCRRLPVRRVDVEGHMPRSSP